MRLSVASHTAVAVTLLHREPLDIVVCESRLPGLEILDDRSGLNLRNSTYAIVVSKASLPVRILSNK